MPHLDTFILLGHFIFEAADVLLLSRLFVHSLPAIMGSDSLQHSDPGS